MKERPIIFSGAMIRQILSGNKTQTRRIVKPPPKLFGGDDNHLGEWWMPVGGIHRDRWHCPYGKPGDRLWVRESFRELGSVQKIDGSLPWRGSPEICVYKADDPHDGPFRPSIHMPRWASRITLEITNIRVERLQDISFADVNAEGLDTRDRFTSWAVPFIGLWDKINGKKHPWASNPWVWVVEFRRLMMNDEEKAAVDRLKAVQEELTREDYLHEQEIAAFDTILAALQSANERADRAEAALRNDNPSLIRVVLRDDLEVVEIYSPSIGATFVPRNEAADVVHQWIGQIKTDRYREEYFRQKRMEVLTAYENPTKSK